MMVIDEINALVQYLLLAPARACDATLTVEGNDKRCATVLVPSIKVNIKNWRDVMPRCFRGEGA
jgi:hypothetical protein